MKNKILWLSILGLALARPPNTIDSTSSNFGEQQQQRLSRSIWPFASSETSTEDAPAEYPPPLPNNNEWFVRGETPLPQGIDLTKYPVWKVHKYNGIDLHPVNLQPENTYPPELQHVIDQGYSSGSSSSSDFPQNIYQDFGAHSTGYSPVYPSPPATYPAEQDNYQTQEFYSSSFPPGSNSFNIQTQHKHEVYAPPEPFKDSRYPAEQVMQGHPQIPSTFYGSPNAYHASTDYRGHSQEGQNQVSGTGEEQSQTSNGSKPDLSFLDDLGGLAPFLPEPTNDNESARVEEPEVRPRQGFFERLFSQFRGSTEAPEAEVAMTENEKLAKSGGFLSSVFGIRSDTRSPEIESAATESSGNVFSSLFYRETESPAVISPTTYYLPKTRGSYIAVKIPTNAASSLRPSIGPYDDISNIAFHEVPRVPFTQHEIPQISGPTLESGYPYSLGHSEIRNSGFGGSAINSDHHSSIAYDQSHLPTTKIAPHFPQNYGSYQQSDFAINDFSSNQDDSRDVPHAEYMHSADNDQRTSMTSSSSQSSSAVKNHEGQRGLHDSRTSEMHQAGGMPLSEDDSPRTFSNPITSYDADELYQNRNKNRNQILDNQQHQYQQAFDTSNSNFQGSSTTQDASDHNPETLSLGQTVKENEPISAPQVSSGFIPSLGYGSPIDAGDQLNSNNANNQGNGQQATSTSENDAYDDVDDTLTQNFDMSSISGRGLAPSKETGPDESSAPVYQTQISSHQIPGNTPAPNDYTFLPVRQATHFQDTSSHQNDGATRFINNLSTLTSYGLPTNSYNSFMAASSNMRNIAVPTPMKDEVNGGVNMNINTNKDVFRSTLPEQLSTKKADRIVHKVMKRRNFAESDYSRRSSPERQAPTEEIDTSLINRSEKDSMPEVRGSRQFYGAQVIDGYSKIQQHQQHQLLTDAAGAAKPVNPVLEQQ